MHIPMLQILYRRRCLNKLTLCNYADENELQITLCFIVHALLLLHLYYDSRTTGLQVQLASNDHTLELWPMLYCSSRIMLIIGTLLNAPSNADQG